MSLKKIEKHILLCFVFYLLFLMVPPVFGKTPDQAIDYLRQGNFVEAKKILEQYLSSYPEDQDVLFYLGQLEPDGKKSVGYFQKALNLGENSQHEDEMLLRLCQYDLSRGLYLYCSNSATRFEGKFKNSPYYPQILWLSASALLASGNIVRAHEEYQNLSSFKDSDWRYYAKLGQADCLSAEGQFPLAVNEYKKIIDEFEDWDLLPIVLIQISNCYAQMGEKDKSILYYNLCKERFPYGISAGEELREKPNPQSSEELESHKAEDLVNVRYTIQLGAFGIRESAESLCTKYKAKGYAVRIANKLVNNKKYYIVQLGSFRSYEEAQKTREDLERESGESYRIVLK